MLQDDEGREVAIKIDRMDSKFSANPDSATKAYMEVRWPLLCTCVTNLYA